MIEHHVVFSKSRGGGLLLYRETGSVDVDNHWIDLHGYICSLHIVLH